MKDLSKLVTKEYEDDGDTYEYTETTLEVNKTERGFGRLEFVDRYGVKCSMQDSSLATEAAIWLGPDDVDPKIFSKEKGWQSYSIPEEVLLSSRMHLTQAMVKQLLPFLINFADTGDYLTSMKEYERLKK